MVPTSNTSLKVFINALLKLNVDRLTIPVDDFFTGKQIMGIHLFKTSSTPTIAEISKEKSDAWLTTISGKSIGKIRKSLFLHAYNPSKQQSVRFGLHRAIKAKTIDEFHGHWMVINSLLQNYKKEGKPRSSLCTFCCSKRIRN